MAFCAASACTGSIGDAPVGSDPKATGGPPGTTTGGVSAPGDNWAPVTACEPRLRTRVTRLTDRHLANAVRDLVGLTAAPALQTSSNRIQEFLPAKPAPVSGTVALSLRDLAENVSGPATVAGKPAVQCSGDETACAGQFIDKFAGRAYRRLLATAERDKLLAVYASGRTNYGGHAGGIRLVIEAVLQSPSFIYLSELGDTKDARRDLTSYEMAAKISFFLKDSVPDDELWQAAQQNKLSTPDEIAVQVDRLLATSEVRANITQMYTRMFDLDGIYSITKAAEVTDFTPALAASMNEETRRFIEATLWNRGASLSKLLSSRDTFVDASLAKIYGIPAPGGTGFSPVTLPASQRAGILTQPSLMTMHALPAESSVVHRGVFMVRQMLCFNPPPPAANFLVQGEAIKKAQPTERGRSDARRAITLCAACHGIFDPLGISFENYDTVGKYRANIDTPAGAVPVDASWNFNLYDLKGQSSNAVELSDKLAQSGAVRECMSRQMASYAFGERLADTEACTISDIAQKLSESKGDLLGLVRQVAMWPGLRSRQEIVQ